MTYSNSSLTLFWDLNVSNSSCSALSSASFFSRSNLSFSSASYFSFSSSFFFSALFIVFPVPPLSDPFKFPVELKLPEAAWSFDMLGGLAYDIYVK